MLTLSDTILRQCREAFLRCDKFNSHAQLQTVFILQDLYIYHDLLPEAENREDRVDKTIEFLLHKEFQGKKPVILRFLQALVNIYIPKEDNLSKELQQISTEIEVKYFLSLAKERETSADLGGPLLSRGDIQRNAGIQVELVKTLLECPSMRNRRRREDVISLLPENIIRISRNDDDSDFFDVLKIVKECLSFNCLEQLVHAVYQCEQETPQWKALETLVRGISRKVVAYTYLLEVETLINAMGCSTSEMKKAYKMCAPRGWSHIKVYNNSNILFLLLEDLAKAPIQSNGTVPVLGFVEWIAYKAQRTQELQQYRDTLHKWTKDRATSLGLTSTQIEGIRYKVQNYEPVEDVYLLITLDTDEESNMFTLRAWLLNSDYKVLKNIDAAQGDELIAIEDLTIKLNHIIEQSEDYLVGTTSNIIIELSLPNVLFNNAVDQCLVSNGLIEVKMGVQHMVLIRSLDRAKKRRLLSSWKIKWNAFQEMVNENEEQGKDIIWICDQEQCEDQRSLYAKLYHSPVTCLALTFVPPDVTSTSSKSLFDTTLSAGTPIMLWSRQCYKKGITRELFLKFLSQGTLTDLPKAIWQERINADKSGDENHYGHHLALLWDDPNRLPPSATAPQFVRPGQAKE